MMLRHPRDGAERVRGRLDRRHDLRELTALGVPQSDFYKVAKDWRRVMHEAIGVPWPCQEAESFGKVWASTIADLNAAEVPVGLASYGGWSDCDIAQAEAIWCMVAHLRPARVVETGVAHGVTARVVLEALDGIGRGQLWSIDLPAVDPALHWQIGVAVRPELRSRWTYIAGTSRERLPGVVSDLGSLDLFVHDSLHTGRNLCFELDTVWPALRPGGAAVVDDIDHSLGFRRFTDRAAPAAWLAAEHVAGHGLWGVAIKDHALAADTSA
jgi:Methyltransferase domain